MSTFWGNDVLGAAKPAENKSPSFWENDVLSPKPASFSKTTEQLRAEHAANLAQSNPTMGQSLNQFTEGVYGGIANAIKGAASVPGAVMDVGQKMAEQTVQGNPLGALGVAGGTALDVAKSVPAYIGEQAGKFAFGGPREMGEVVGENVYPLGAGPALGIAGEAAQGAAGLAAKKLVDSTIRTSVKDLAFKANPTAAILKHKIVGNSLEDYATNVQGKIDELLGKVETKLATSKKTIPVNDITAVLDDEVKRIKGGIGISNKKARLDQIQELQTEILDRYAGKELTLPEAHALRKEIDSNIKWSMDAVEQGANASKYEARTGINRLIERQEPGVQAINKDVSSLLSAKEALERRAVVQGRNNVLGLKDIAAFGAGELGGLAAGVPGAGLASVAAERLLGSTAVKSRAAQVLHQLAGGERSVPVVPGVAPETVPETPTPGAVETASTKFSEPAKPTVKGTFKDELFNFPERVDTTYTGPERRKLPRAEGTIKEEEFNWPESVSDLKNPTTEKYSGYSPKRGKIVLNDEAMDKVTKLLKAKHLDGAEIHSGTAVGGADAAGRDVISMLKKELPKEFAMVPTNKPLTIQRIGDSAYFKQIGRHEGLHRAVNEVLGEKLEISPTKLGIKGRKVFGEVHGKPLTEAGTEGTISYGMALKTKAGYAPTRKAEEVLADLATGNPMRLGLTRVEGLQVLNDMLEQMITKYGVDRVEVLMKRFSPRFYERTPERTGMTLPKFKGKSAVDLESVK